MMIIRGVNLFPSQIEEQILTLPQLGGHFQIEIYREGALDHLRVNVELRASDGPTAATEASRELTRRIKNVIGVSAAVNVVPVGAIERSQGKAVRVIDHRKLR
jgi:phenylacetate-CoA ligase